MHEAVILPAMVKQADIQKDDFAGNTLDVAKALLGKKLIYRDCTGIIVETEAYRTDAASHYITRPRQGVMLAETYGCVYIYLIYGMYFCLNFTTEKDGIGAVLIRAVEPLTGIDQMKKRRGTKDKISLTNGPGKLTQAFAIDQTHHGEEVGKSIKLLMNSSVTNPVVARGPRIGISKSRNLPWRFWIANNPYVSK